MHELGYFWQINIFLKIFGGGGHPYLLGPGCKPNGFIRINPVHSLVRPFVCPLVMHLSMKPL